MRDFRTIIQQIPGFLEAMGDVHGVAANLDGLREAFNNTGGSIRDLVIPVFDELSRRFEAPPTDSYIVAMDTLENAFRLAQASIGGLFLPTVVDAAQALTIFFEAIREGTDAVSTLPEPIQDIVRGAMELYEALQNVGGTFVGIISPSVRELASNLASLLGEVLGLAGALYNSLEPIIKAQAAILGTVVAAVAELAEHITLLISGLTDAVNWVSSFWREQDQAATSTENLTEKVDQHTKALDENTAAKEKNVSAGDQERQRLKELQSELDATNEKIARYTKAIGDAGEVGSNNRSTQQYIRLLATAQARAGELTSEIERLSETYGGASAALGENATETEQQEAKLADLQTQLASVNREVETYQERLAKARQEAVGETNPAIEQLERRLGEAEARASGLQTEIETLTSSLIRSAADAEMAASGTENYGLALARLKANAEDTRQSLSDTIDISELGANYSAAIAASDAYYNTLIAHAQDALAQEEENSEAYQEIQTGIFELERQQLQAREQLTAQASKIGEAEAKRRVAIAEQEAEAQRKIQEESHRASREAQKRRTEAEAEAEQQLTAEYEEALKAREESQIAADQRIAENSQEQLKIQQNAFQNALPAGVDAAYAAIQQSSIEHYELLKAQAETRIGDEDDLNREIVRLDRERNTALQQNHRAYIQRIASDAKDLLGERTDAFSDSSDAILHNWDQTVAEFERRLREAETEEALQEIEGEFTQAQQQMLDSLNSVLIELGFTAEQATEIMTGVLRTAETEADGFAGKVLSALQRLGREAARETRQQNREIERAYRDLVRDIEDVLGGITDFFIGIARGDDIQEAFKDLGSQVAGSFLDQFFSQVSHNLATGIADITTATDVARTGTSTAATQGNALQSAGGLASVLSLVTSPAALAVLIPAAVGAATYYIGRQVAGGTSEGTDRRGRPLGDEAPRRRRGETQAAFERRLAALEEAQVIATQRAEFQRRSDPIAPFRRLIQESSVFSGDFGVFAQGALGDVGIDDITGGVDLPGLVEGLEGVVEMRIQALGDAMEIASDNLDNATGVDLQPTLQGYIQATTEFYQTQIDFDNLIRRTTGNLSFGDVESLNRELQNRLNQSRLQDPTLSRGYFQQLARDAERERQEGDRTQEIARLQYGEGFDPNIPVPDAGTPVSELDTTEIDTALAELARFDADAAFEETFEAFRANITAVPATIEQINTEFNNFQESVLRPRFDELRSQILDDDGVVSAAEELALKEAGVFDFQDFAEPFREIADSAIQGVQTAEQALAEYIGGSEFQQNVTNFRTSLSASGITIDGINAAWSEFQESVLRPEFERLRSLILDDDGVVSATEELELRRQGVFSFEDYSSRFTDIRDSAITGIETTQTALASYVAEANFSENVDAFRASLTASGQTVASVNRAWRDFVANTLQPEYERLRNLILDDDGIVSAAEQLALEQQGVVSFEGFTSQFTGIRDAAVEGIQATETALANYIAASNFEQNVQAFRETLAESSNTIADTNAAWNGFVENTLRPEYERLRGLILDDDGVVSAAEDLQLRQQGLFSFEDFTNRFVGIKDAAVEGIESAEDALATYIAESQFAENVNAFRGSITEAGNTIADVNSAWTAFLENTLRPEFERLRSLILDDDGIIDATEEVALRAQGLYTFEDFTGQFVDIKDTAIEGIQSAETALANYIAESGFEQNVEAFRTSVLGAADTVSEVNTAWTDFLENVLRPEYERLRGLILDDDGVIDATEALALRRAGVFSFEDFSGQFVGLRDSAVEGITSTETALANYVAESGFESNVEAFRSSVSAIGNTVADVNLAWDNFVENTLRPEYERLRGLILDDNGIISAAENLALQQQGVFSFQDFSGEFRGLADSAITGIESASQARVQSGLQTGSNLAQNRVNRAQFNLSQAGSEGEFEQLRATLIEAIQDFYETEETRIRALGLSAGDLTDQLQDLDLNREQALASAFTTSNRFAEQRIQSEQDFADAIRDIDADLAESRRDIESELADDLETIDQRLADKREDIATELSEDLETIDERLADKRQDINDELSDDLQRVDERLADRRADIEEGLADDLERINKRLADRVRDNEESLADDLSQINDRLSDRIQDNRERLNDRLADLAEDAVDAEAENLQRIEDLNRDHAQTIQDIHEDSAHRIEDIELDLQRRMADINRDAERSIADLEDDPTKGPRTQAALRQQAIAEINQDRERRIADARTRAERGHEDVATRQARELADLAEQTALKRAEIERRAAEEQVEILEERQQVRQESAEAHQRLLAEAEEARVEARQESEESHQRLLAEAAEARVEARREAEASHLQALADAEDARIQARQASQEQHQQALADAEDARQTARLEAEKSEKQAIETAADARQEARLEAEKAEHLARENASDARQEARLNLESTSQEQRENTADTRQSDREGISDTRLTSREDFSDTRQSERDAEALTSATALEDLRDDRESSRLGVFNDAALLVEDVRDAHNDERIAEILQAMTVVDATSDRLFAAADEARFAASALASATIDANAAASRIQEAISEASAAPPPRLVERVLTDAEYQSKILADRAELNERRERARAERRGSSQVQINAEIPVNINSREVARAIYDETVILEEQGILTSGE